MTIEQQLRAIAKKGYVVQIAGVGSWDIRIAKSAWDMRNDKTYNIYSVTNNLSHALDLAIRGIEGEL